MNILIAAVAFVVAFIVWRIIATVNASTKTERAIDIKLEPIHKFLSSGKELPKDLVNTLAENPAVRYRLYRILLAYNQLQMLAKKYLSLESFFDAQLCFWLQHPNELGIVPENIGLLKKIPKKIGMGINNFYVYKFRTLEPHWAAKKGWCVGVVGPCPEEMTLIQIIQNNVAVAFSSLDRLVQGKEVSEYVEDFCKSTNQSPGGS